MSTFSELNTQLDELAIRATAVKNEHDQLIADTNANANAISVLESLDILDVKDAYTTMSEFESAGIVESEYKLYHDVFVIDGAIYVLVPFGTQGEVSVPGWTTKSLKKLSDAVQLSALDDKIDAAKIELNNSISAVESKHDIELASEVAARQAAIAAEAAERETAIAAEASARDAKDVEIAAAQASDKAATIETLGGVVEVLNNRLENQ